jgi:lactoylglutathione lyase
LDEVRLQQVDEQPLALPDVSPAPVEAEASRDAVTDRQEELHDQPRPNRLSSGSRVVDDAWIAFALYDPRVTRYLHTMYRITDPEKSRTFYEALGLEFRRDLPIVRNGELEATNYFFGVPGQEEELELTFNHDGRTYDLGSGYGHIALAVDDLDQTLARLKEQGIEPEREPYRVREGGSRLCFVRDPDDYRIELIERAGR